MTKPWRMAEPSAWLLMAATALLVQGCARPAQQVSSARLYAIDQAGQAKSCTVSKVGSLTPGQETAVTMAVGNDGGWCAISVAQEGAPFAAGLLTGRPAHGKVYIHPVGDYTRIDYTPERGFAGTDTFSVKLLPGSPVLRATVTVTGAAATPASAPAQHPAAAPTKPAPKPAAPAAKSGSKGK